MYKFFSLAAIIAVVPVIHQNSIVPIIKIHPESPSAYAFNFKKNEATNLFDSENKSTENWGQNWMTSAQENIRKSEYHIKWEEKLKAYCTPNRKNNLRFFYSDKGFSVEPRTTKIPIGDFDPVAKPHEIKYKNISNWKVKFNLDKSQVGNGKWQIVNNKAEYITEKITVQYINNDDGMRQNFIVHKPLSKRNALKINFSIKTKLKTFLHGNQLQFFQKNIHVLNYKDLKVWDAAGTLLQASFKKKNKHTFYIQVDTKNAVYPVTVDPISTTPAALLESNQINANLGFSVASAGDVNSDGYSDVIAGAHAYDNPQADEGAAFIFHGSATGVSTTAAAIVESNQAGARLGISVSTAGDVNGDGYSDIIIGANLYDGIGTDEGAAFIYHGSNSGIVTTPAIILVNNQALAQMGFSVACAGDVNNDGYSDVIVGAWLFDNPEVNEGVAFVYHGANTGISGTIATTLEANQSASNFGISVAGAGDANGDGFSDVIVGAENFNSGQTEEGVVFIFHGSTTGINNVAVTMAESDQGFSQFGFSVSSAGDINGDGYSDVIVGAYTFDNVEINEGAAFIYHGSAAGINNIAADTLESNLVNVQFGVSVACAGDINGDGYSDLIVGANTYDNVETDEGAAYVFFGSATGINIIAVAILESNQANAQMGRAVASAGDVNGDGYSDVIVGAPQFDNTENNEGAAFVYHGAAAGISTTFAATVENNQANAYFGGSAASAGDVNGDGFSDVIVGSRYFDNGNTDEGAAFVFHGSASGLNTIPVATMEGNQNFSNFGFSVACAGDVNGDGYSDVIVGAYTYDNGTTDEGTAYVYHGSPSGINTTPAVTLDIGQVNAYFGTSVASAGDVNGDGYSDVIVGAYEYDNVETNEGAAFVYHGSSSGINPVPVTTLESNQPGAFFGFYLSGAGDVNGDGYGDVIVGAFLYDNPTANEGAAFIYHGGVTGVDNTADAILESNSANTMLGISVACAGDVNGDGYGDVIVGSHLYTNGNTNEGAAFIYHGSASGINTTVVAILESNQVSANMGFCVAGAGDVNGDGYSDLIAGAWNYDNGQTDEGAAFIYHGSATGINISAAAMVESNQASANLGKYVACAGDINGDGYSDVIVGAERYDNPDADEGVALVYTGNNTGGRRNSLRLYNTNLTTPINSSNFLFGNFGAGLFANSFLGKSKGKLVWETRLNYNAYSGTPITNSTFFTAQQSSYTEMGLTGVELKNLIAKINGGRYTKLRARIKYDPVTALTGQVYSPWRNVSSIIDANNLGVLPIELISFNAAWIQKGNTTRLDFKTDKESGICCFDIEKSADGFNFYSIGTLPAKNISGIQSYTFIDNNAKNKKQYYRIRIQGIAGQVEYSNIQQLQHNGNTEILVFPNPTTDVLQVQLNAVFDNMNVQIINSAGQIVKKIQLTASNQTISIPVQNLATGKYWLHMQGGNEKQVIQFVKQ